MHQAQIPFLSASDIYRMLEKKEVSPVEATEAYLDRIDSLDFKFKSYITVMRNQAMEAARDAEAAKKLRVPPQEGGNRRFRLLLLSLALPLRHSFTPQ